MYAALWRILPGPAWAKVMQLLLILFGILALLIFVVFPFAADVFLVEDSVVGAS
jgi:hypothetical protein